MLVQKKTVISNIIFTILFSYCTLSNAQYDKSFKSKFPTGNAFVKFFKYGKHSVLYNGLSGRTIEELKHYCCQPNCNCLPSIADFILSLFSARLECRYRYKPLWAIYFNCSLLNGFSYYDFLNDEVGFYIINPNFGISYTLLHKKSFSWRMYAGVGVMWGANMFRCNAAYDAAGNSNDDVYKQLQEAYKSKGTFIYWFKEYFSSEHIASNLKHFDVIIDLSAFDFVIKDHFRISLAWNSGVANFYKVILNKPHKLLGKFLALGVLPLVISIGYQF